MVLVKGAEPGAIPHVADLLGGTMGALRQVFQDEDWGGLRTSHHRLLTQIPEEGINVTELAARLGMTKQGCGQLVTTLTAAGQLETGTDQHDRRVRVVRRTPAGHRTVAAVLERIQQIEDSWAAQVGPRRYATFRRVMLELTADAPAARSNTVLTTRSPTAESGVPAASSGTQPAAARH